MFPERNRVLSPVVCCFKTPRAAFLRALPTINTIDYENGGFIGPAFFKGPHHETADDTVVFLHTVVGNIAEAWEQAQNKLSVNAVLWTVAAPEGVDMDAFAEFCASFTTPESVVPITDFKGMLLLGEED